jgi:hypothetical protein
MPKQEVMRMFESVYYHDADMEKFVAFYRDILAGGTLRSAFRFVPERCLKPERGNCQ